MSVSSATPSWSLKYAAEQGGQAMLAWLDPLDNYMPLSGYEPAHDVGRWWDAMLRLEQATGFAIPAAIEAAMLANLKRLTDNPDALLVCGNTGRWQPFINPHNLRETLLAYHALVRWRDSDWARQQGHRFLQTLDRALREDGHFDVTRLGLWGTIPMSYDTQFIAETENADGWFDATMTSGRCLEAMVWFYEATGDDLALRLADRLARLHLRLMADADGEARPEFFAATHLGHNHSYMGTLRGLFLFGRLTGQRAYGDAVTKIYRHSLWRQNISRDGWTTHDLGCTKAKNQYGDKQYESASAGDIAQLALWLGVHEQQTELLDDVERILRSNLLPAQITRADVGAPARRGDITVAENWIGGWGCQYERHVKDLIYDVLAAVVHSLADLYEHTTVRGPRGLTLLWHFDYEDAQLRVTQSRTDEAVLCVQPKSATPLRIRLPAWVPNEAVRVSLGEQSVTPARIGSFLYLPEELLQNRPPITVRYPLPAHRSEEAADPTRWCLEWRGDTVVEALPLRPAPTPQSA